MIGLVRPSKEEYYMNIAKAVSLRSPCIRRKYGAIIVKEDVIVSTGYNGPARGVINCFEVGCLKDEVGAPHGSGYDYCIGVHAEENAIINAARSGASVLDGTLYIYGEDPDGRVVEAKPCERCRRAIINAGIRRVYVMRSDESIVEINVEDWVKAESREYVKRLEKARVSGESR